MTSHPGLLLPRATVIAITIAAGGCAPAHPQHYAYVFSIGDARKITQWTLAQVDEDPIADGMSALGSLAGDESEPEARAAIDGFEQIHSKLVDGWPGFTGYSELRRGDRSRTVVPEVQRTQNLEHLIRRGYTTLARARGSRRNTRLINQAYLRIKPGADHPARLEAWNEAAKAFNIPTAQ